MPIDHYAYRSQNHAVVSSIQGTRRVKSNNFIWWKRRFCEESTHIWHCRSKRDKINSNSSNKRKKKPKCPKLLVFTVPNWSGLYWIWIINLLDWHDSIRNKCRKVTERFKGNTWDFLATDIQNLLLLLRSSSADVEIHDHHIDTGLPLNRNCVLFVVPL